MNNLFVVAAHNTVVVDGTPVDPDGAALCGAETDPPTDECDVSANDNAQVTVNPSVLPPEPGGTEGGLPASSSVSSSLADTGGPPWLRTLIVLGLGLVLTGSGLVAASERHRRRARA